MGTWNVVDPLADHSYDKTPYHYCSNNPLNRTDPDGMCDEPGCPHKGGFNNEMSPVENILRDAWDKAVSGLVTVGTYLANKATNGTYPVLEANFTYGANGRVGKLAPVSGSPDLAALGGAANVASVIPTAGPTAGLIAKVVGGKTAIVEGVEGITNSVNKTVIGTSSEYLEATGKNSIGNVKTNVSANEFGSNLEKSGFAKSVSKDGRATIFTKGDAKYAIRQTSQTSRGTPGSSADYFYKTDEVFLKIRLNEK